MIILWARHNGGMCVWASTGYHTKMDLAKALIERNAAGLSYVRATNEKAEEVVYEEIMREIEKINERP